MKLPQLPAWLKHTLLGVGGFLGVATLLIGFAHTPSGRPLMHWLANSAGCPVDFDADPAAAEAFRIQRLRSRAGETAAATHPALGFELGKTTREQVNLWLNQQALNCESQRHAAVIQCANVVDLGGLPVRSLHLQFDAADRLVAVDVQRGELCSQDAVTHLKRLQTKLESNVGALTARVGRLDASYLDQQRFARSALEFRYSNYLAKISATHLDASGITVREQYQWTPPQG